MGKVGISACNPASTTTQHHIHAQRAAAEQRGISRGNKATLCSGRGTGRQTAAGEGHTHATLGQHGTVADTYIECAHCCRCCVSPNLAPL